MFNLFKRKEKCKKNVDDNKQDLRLQDTRELCKSCNYKCCKRLTCRLSPSDFLEITFDTLKFEMEKGYIAIINAVSPYDEAQYILQVRMKDCPIIDMGHYSHQRGECVFLTHSGCSKEKKERPKGEPRIHRIDSFDRVKCNPKYNVTQCADDWKPYEELLFELADVFRHYPDDYPCSN